VSERPALTFTSSPKRPAPSVVSLWIPNRSPVAPRNETVSRTTKNQPSARRLTLALGLDSAARGIAPQVLDAGLHSELGVLDPTPGATILALGPLPFASPP
jgi:hypothetical protein